MGQADLLFCETEMVRERNGAGSGSPLPVTIWMNMPSFYQNDLFRALARMNEVDLEVIFARRLSQNRTNLGWETNVEGFSSSYLSRLNPIGDACQRAVRRRGRIHIVNGVWGEMSFAAALTALAAVRARYAIYSEAPNPLDHRSMAKRIARSAFGPMVARGAGGWFPVARLGAGFFRSIGAPRDDIYPFGYFRSTPLPRATAMRPEADRLEVVYVGQVIERKGVDLLLDAMLPLFDRFPTLHLRIVGDGDMTGRLRADVAGTPAAEKVTFAGVVSSVDAPAVIARADVLVLPSRWDGWGLVVNEALSQGVPVVVSTQCGAADLVRDGSNGFVFKSEDVTALRTCIETLLGDQSVLAACRVGAARSGRLLGTDVVAPYLVDCLRHMVGELDDRPAPPWLCRSAHVSR